MTPLARRLAEEISQSGAPLRFDRFMERALFDPEHGYYGADRARIGREGDFHTSVSVGRMFGAVLAEQFAEIWDRLGRPARFDLVEQGANDGRLAADILDALHRRHPACAAAVRYTSVEPFPRLAERQRATLSAFGTQVHRAKTLGELEPFSGVHFTNEYADALPVRLFLRAGDGWQERFVSVADGALAWLDRPSDTADLPREAAPGYLAELRPAADAWLAEAASRLERGLVLVVDYGFPRDQLHASWRNQGTLSCYRSNRRDDDPLESPGEKDITAHVDFTALARAGLRAGLRLAGYTDQYHFLVGAATPLLVEREAAPDAGRAADLRGLKTLLHPEMMGTQFKYLALARDLDAPLSGFRHAAPPGPALGLA